MRGWASGLIAKFDEATVSFHWTDEPYVWHVNSGQEVSTVQGITQCCQLQYLVQKRADPQFASMWAETYVGHGGCF